MRGNVSCLMGPNLGTKTDQQRQSGSIMDSYIPKTMTFGFKTYVVLLILRREEHQNHYQCIQDSQHIFNQ